MLKAEIESHVLRFFGAILTLVNVIVIASLGAYKQDL